MAKEKDADTDMEDEFYDMLGKDVSQDPEDLLKRIFGDKDSDAKKHKYKKLLNKAAKTARKIPLNKGKVSDLVDKIIGITEREVKKAHKRANKGKK